MFNIIIITKIRELLTSDRKCTSVDTFPITWWYYSDQWRLPQMNCMLPFAPTHISWYQTLHFWQHTQSFFPRRFGRVIISKAKKPSSYFLNIFFFFFVTEHLSSALLPVRLCWPSVIRSVVVGEKSFWFWGIFRILIWGKVAKQNHKKSRCNMFRKNIFVKHYDVWLKDNEASYWSPFASNYSKIFPIINPLNTERRLFYLKTQFIPRSKHFSSRL